MKVTEEGILEDEDIIACYILDHSWLRFKARAEFCAMMRIGSVVWYGPQMAAAVVFFVIYQKSDPNARRMVLLQVFVAAL